jgi:hypothetical protein
MYNEKELKNNTKSQGAPIFHLCKEFRIEYAYVNDKSENSADSKIMKYKVWYSKNWVIEEFSIPSGARNMQKKRI